MERCIQCVVDAAVQQLAALQSAHATVTAALEKAETRRLALDLLLQRRGKPVLAFLGPRDREAWYQTAMLVGEIARMFDVNDPSNEAHVEITPSAALGPPGGGRKETEERKERKETARARHARLRPRRVSAMFATYGAVYPMRS